MITDFRKIAVLVAAMAALVGSLPMLLRHGVSSDHRYLFAGIVAGLLCGCAIVVFARSRSHC